MAQSFFLLVLLLLTLGASPSTHIQQKPAPGDVTTQPITERTLVVNGTQRKEVRHKIDVRLSPQHDTLGKAIKLSVRAREGYR